MFPPVRFSLTVLPECRSSQEEVLSLRGQPGFHGAAVLALRQTSGYGRRGRNWSTGQGNLALSLGLELPGAHGALALLPFVAGVAVYQAAKKFLPGEDTLRLKWPNDLYLRGKKLSGLIAQARQYGEGSEVVLGIGLNLAEAPLPGLSIALGEVARAPAPGEFARVLLAELENAFRDARDFSWVRSRWEEGARLGESPLYIVGEEEPVQPLALLETGELLVETKAGQKRKLASEETSVRYQPTEN